MLTPINQIGNYTNSDERMTISIASSPYSFHAKKDKSAAKPQGKSTAGKENQAEYFTALKPESTEPFDLAPPKCKS